MWWLWWRNGVVVVDVFVFVIVCGRLNDGFGDNYGGKTVLCKHGGMCNNVIKRDMRQSDV